MAIGKKISLHNYLLIVSRIKINSFRNNRFRFFQLKRIKKVSNVLFGFKIKIAFFMSLPYQTPLQILWLCVFV